MDGVSSAFAVVSLAIQLGGSIKKLCDFWEAIQDCPKDIQVIVIDLKIISSIIEDICEEVNTARPHSRALTSIHAALYACAESTQTLEEMIAESQSGLLARKRSVRAWAAFKIAWNKDKLRKYLDTLSHMKMTLMLVKQNSIDRAAIARDESNQQDLATIAQGMKILLQRQSQETMTTVMTEDLDFNKHFRALRDEYQKTVVMIGNPVARCGFQTLIESALLQVQREFTGNSTSTAELVDSEISVKRMQKPPARLFRSRRSCLFTVSSLFGKLHLAAQVQQPLEQNARTDEQETDNQACHSTVHTTLTFHPSQWLLTIGVSFGVQVLLSRSFRGLDYRLKTYRAVSDNALIFELCKRKEIGAIQSLFDKRQASPWDTNSKGLSPLFFAARAGQVKTCRLLLSQGADVETRTLSNDTVASYACPEATEGGIFKRCNKHIDVLRIFLDNFEFSDDINCTGLLGLRRLLFTSRCSHPSCTHGPEYPAAFVWALPLLQGWLAMNVPSMASAIAQLFSHAMKADDIELMSLLMTIIGDINSKRFVRWFSPALEIALNMYSYGIRSSDRWLLHQGLDIHVTADEDFTRVGDFLYLGDYHSLTSFVMQYSYSFFLFRSLLRDEGIDFESYIEQELKNQLLVEAGWTKETLSFLFNVDFSPLKRPLITCQDCYGEGVPKERSWLTVLEKLKSRSLIEVLEIFEARDKNLPFIQDGGSNVCHYCQTTGSQQDEDDFEEAGSAFLVDF